MSLAHVNDHTPALPGQGRFDEGQLDVLRRTIAADLTEDEFALFGQVCQRTGLDPFARQIWAIKRRSKKNVKNDRTGQWEEVWEEHLTIQTGIDGYRLIAERSGRYRGQTEPEWCGPDGRWVDIWLSADPPAAARVGVLRDDFATPVMGIAMFDEFAATTGQGQNKRLTGQWRTMPAHMIAKCAEALAIRKAFPNDVYGIYTVEEMGQADNGGAIEAGAREHRGIPAEQFREIVAAAEQLTADQIAELQEWRDAEGLVIKPQELTQDDARRVMEKILELGRGGGGGDEPVEGSAAAPPPPENENPTQKGGGDDDSAGKGSPGAQPAAAGPGERSSEAESEPPPAPVGAGEAAASSAPSGVTAEQLRAAVAHRHPDRDTARKQEITAAKTAAAVAGALSIKFGGGFDDLVADQTLAAAVLADLRGDDAPPPGSGGGQDPAVGEQPPAQASDSGPAPAVPAPTAAPEQPVALKTESASDWRKENARCQALAAEHLSGDAETLKSQREALAYQASGGRVTSWSDVTRTEFSLIRSWLEFIAAGHGRVVESDAPLHFGWQVVLEEAA